MRVSKIVPLMVEALEKKEVVVVFGILEEECLTIDLRIVLLWCRYG